VVHAERVARPVPEGGVPAEALLERESAGPAEGAVMKAAVYEGLVRDYSNDELHLRLPDHECEHGFIWQDANRTCECWKKAKK
jgi:hypothetical protein